MNKVDEYKGTFQAIALQHQWVFRFKNLHYDKIKDNFRGEISDLLDKHNNSFEEILKNKSYINVLRRIFVDNFEDGLNETSLMMLSRPLSRGWIIDDYNYQRRGCIKCGNCTEENQEYQLRFGQSSTLLLGDHTIESNLVERYFRTKRHVWLPQVVQLPHHGARLKHHPYHCELCHELRYRCHFPISFVASYGFRNKYGHPDLPCIHCHPGGFCYGYLNLVMVNERKDFSYTILY
jgi:hypothetical protein